MSTSVRSDGQQAPKCCFKCSGASDCRPILGAFRNRDFGHVQCLNCGISFDSNLNELLEEDLTNERISSIGNREDYMRLFVETWTIADQDTDEIYPNFDWEDNQQVRTGVARRIVDAIRVHFPQQERLRILDVGCGNGFTTVELAKEFGKDALLGIDPSPSVGELARVHGIGAVQGTLDTVSLPDASFDVVVIVGNIMLHRDPRFSLAESYRILRPGGLLIADYKNVKCLIRRIAGVGARLSPRRLGRNSFIQRNFLNMRYGFHRGYFNELVGHTGFKLLVDSSKPPRLLEFRNASTYQTGWKGLIWRATDAIDRLGDNRAWIQITAQKPKDDTRATP